MWLPGVADLLDTSLVPHNEQSHPQGVKNSEFRTLKKTDVSVFIAHCYEGSIVLDFKGHQSWEPNKATQQSPHHSIPHSRVQSTFTEWLLATQSFVKPGVGWAVQGALGAWGRGTQPGLRAGEVPRRKVLMSLVFKNLKEVARQRVDREVPRVASSPPQFHLQLWILFLSGSTMLLQELGAML